MILCIIMSNYNLNWIIEKNHLALVVIANCIGILFSCKMLKSSKYNSFYGLSSKFFR